MNPALHIPHRPSVRAAIPHRLADPAAPVALSVAVQVARGGCHRFHGGRQAGQRGRALLLKTLVDAMSFKPGDPAAMLVVPVGLLVAYGALRLSTSVFNELRELVFAKATQGRRARLRCRPSSTCTR